jgi:hypothetical protein
MEGSHELTCRPEFLAGVVLALVAGLEVGGIRIWLTNASVAPQLSRNHEGLGSWVLAP